MKKLLLIVGLVLSLTKLWAVTIVPGSSFPITNSPQSWMRLLGVDTNGNASSDPNTRSNFTIRWDDLQANVANYTIQQIGTSGNVLLLGAKGGTNDDTAVLQGLFNLGGQYYFPPTNYTTGPLYLTNNTILTGSGGAVIKLLPASTNLGIFNFSFNTNIVLQDMTLDGGYYASLASRNANSNRIGINYYLNSVGSRIQGMVIRGFDKGVNIYSGPSDNSLGIYNIPKGFISQVECSSNYNGIFAFSTDVDHTAEYFTPCQLYLHNNVIGYYDGGGNISIFGNNITANGIGILVDGAVQNAAHGTIFGNAINHNVNYGILVRNLTTQNENIYDNQIRANVSGIAILLTNAMHVTIGNNQFDADQRVDIGVSGVSGSSQGPNYFYNNTYSGIWGSVNFKLVDWNDTSDLVYGNTTNAQHWGNYSYNVSSNADPYVANPYNFSAIQLTPTNVVPLIPFTPNASFLWNSNGVALWIVRSTGLAWSSTNAIASNATIGPSVTTNLVVWTNQPTFSVGQLLVITGTNANGSLVVAPTNSISGTLLTSGTLPFTAADSTWYSLTNVVGWTNQPTFTVGQALVITGTNAQGVLMVQATNWPSGGGSTPNGLVTNYGLVTVIVPTPLVITNTSESDSMRISAQLDTVAGAFVSGNNFETLLLAGKTNGNSSSASGITANIIHIQNPRGGILLDTDSQIVSSNSTTKTYTQMDTNNVWHFGSNSVETASIAPVTGTITGSNFTATGSGASSNWLGGISFIASNAAPSTTIAPSGLNSITMNQPWTNNFNRLADLEICALFTDAVTGNPNLAFTNTVTGQAWTNAPLSALIAGTSQITIVIPDISPNDFGSFSNYSGTGASVSFIKAWWHLK